MAYLEVRYWENQASIDYECYNERNTYSSVAKRNKNQQYVPKNKEKGVVMSKIFLME